MLRPARERDEERSEAAYRDALKIGTQSKQFRRCAKLTVGQVTRQAAFDSESL